MLSCVDSTRLAPAVKDHFSALPNRLQDDPRLKPRDLATIAAILRYARAKHWASMSNHALADHGRCSERSIQYSLARLEHSGWISREACDDAPGSRSGRIIYLNWRRPETPCTPDLKTASPQPVLPVAPEVDSEEREEKPAHLSLDGSGPDGQMKTGPTPLPDPLDYAALGWLDRPASDPLRKIAEKALASRMAGPPAPGSGRKASVPSRSLLRAPGSLAEMLGRQLGGR
ncbi:hypothetical protein EP7_005605 (plasmid) [Isosphaeraceae bacterium EP7]